MPARRRRAHQRGVWSLALLGALRLKSGLNAATFCHVLTTAQNRRVGLREVRQAREVADCCGVNQLRLDGARNCGELAQPSPIGEVHPPVDDI